MLVVERLDTYVWLQAHGGVATTRFTRDVLCASLPLLRPLVLVLKQLLASAGSPNPSP